MSIKIPKLGLFVKDENIIDKEFGSLKISKEKIRKFSFHQRGSIRLSKMKYYGDNDFEDRKKRVINKKLP